MADIILKTTEAVSLHIESLVSTIKIADGFETDIGLRVFQGKRAVDDDEIPCISIIEGLDHPGDTRNRTEIKTGVDYALVAYLRCDPDRPNTAAHQALRDLKKVIFEKTRLGFRVGALDYRGRDIGARSDGQPFVMAVLHFTVDIAETLPGGQ